MYLMMEKLGVEEENKWLHLPGKQQDEGLDRSVSLLPCLLQILQDIQVGLARKVLITDQDGVEQQDHQVEIGVKEEQDHQQGYLIEIDVCLLQ